MLYRQWSKLGFHNSKIFQPLHSPSNFSSFKWAIQLPIYLRWVIWSIQFFSAVEIFPKSGVISCKRKRIDSFDFSSTLASSSFSPSNLKVHNIFYWEEFSGASSANWLWKCGDQIATQWPCMCQLSKIRDLWYKSSLKLARGRSYSLKSEKINVANDQAARLSISLHYLAVTEMWQFFPNGQ